MEILLLEDGEITTWTIDEFKEFLDTLENESEYLKVLFKWVGKC